MEEEKIESIVDFLSGRMGMPGKEFYKERSKIIKDTILFYNKLIKISEEHKTLEGDLFEVFEKRGITIKITVLDGAKKYIIERIKRS